MSNRFYSVRRRQVLKRKYKLTSEEYDRILAAQDGKCAICYRPPDDDRVLAVDHCHRTGKVRGLLCGLCNRALGCLGDDTTLLYRAIDYLERQPRR